MSLTDEVVEAERAIPLRVLIFDVETAPLLSYHWRVWKENVAPDQLQNRAWMICWAARWAGQKTVRSDAVTPEEALAEDDSRIVGSLAELVRRADVILAHNVDRFDLPVLNTRLLDLRLEPLPPVRTIDTLKVAKRSFRFTYNRLSYLAEFLGIEAKHQMRFPDWLAAVKGDRTAITKMRSYCKQDINVLEQVWTHLQPYAKGTPRLVEATHEMHRACPHCGAGFSSLKPSGTHRTNASNFQRYRCDVCQKFSRTRSAAKGTKLSLHPL
jgi:hypothetical protein